MANEYTSKKLADLIQRKLLHNFGIEPSQASDEFFYKATALVILDILTERRTATRKETAKQQAKTVYYLSMEFLMGRSLKNNLFNLNLESTVKDALKKFNVKLENLYELEPDAGLGNGGLGRLAACFLDALSNGNYPAMGYCIKYEFGIFRQKIIEGWQTEMPDFWLPGGSVWLEARPASAVTVKFDGHVDEWWDGNHHNIRHEDYTSVRAMPYDLMIPGKDGKTVNALRLWSAEYEDINMSAFNKGDYVKALEDKANTEVISKVLYPEDNHLEGKSLRLRQQYFLVSASVQDILNRHIRVYGTLENLSEKVAIHINDTHPTLCIPELMRFLLDECGYSWDKAWSIVTKTVAYTNHTVMAEALECWSEDLFKRRLPRIYQIVKEIDKRFRNELMAETNDFAATERNSIIQNGMIHMANLCVAASHSVNGVSRLHSNILKDSLFNDFYKITPDKFKNVTNGIAHRRWLCQSNPLLTSYLTELIGDGFVTDAAALCELEKFKGNKDVLMRLDEIKRANKERLSNHIKNNFGISVNPDSLFDMQVKRLHEYKRQHLNLMHIISEYLYLKDNPNADFVPKTYIFGAKAAPGYYLAKEIICLINQFAKLVESDRTVNEKLKIVFLEDYRVSLAELMIPAANISEQISLASTEASGTGNMKLMMNGAITLGTEDGANVEIHEAVGDDNIIIFGMETPEVMRLKKLGYSPNGYIENNPTLKRVVDFIGKGINGQSFDSVYRAITTLDSYMSMADFTDYCRAHETADKLYSDKLKWNDMSLINIAKSGIFSADRSIKDYANDIWNIKPIK